MDAITGRKNPKVAHMKKLGSSHAYRLERGEFLCDGEKLLAEAVKNGAQVKTVMYCGDAPDVCPPGAGIYSVPRDIIEYISPLKTPQNILFSVGIPDMEGQLPEGGRYIILDAVSDPGNVGTVIRTADAFGIDAVIFMGECADLYNPKTVRATMGAVFRQRVLRADVTVIEKLKDAGVRVYAAALHRDSEDIRDISHDNCAVVIGSEGHGVSEGVINACHKTVVIPMGQQCESLNAASAAAVIMWELVRGDEHIGG